MTPLEIYAQLPVFSKEKIFKLLKKYSLNFTHIALKNSNPVRIGLTSGTTYFPMTVYYSRNFWTLMLNHGINYYSHFLSKEDRVGILYYPGLSPAFHFHKEIFSRLHILHFALGYYPIFQIIKFIKDYKINSLCGNVSTILDIVEKLRSKYHNYKFKWILASGEKMEKRAKQRIEKLSGARVYQWSGAGELLLFGFGCLEDNLSLHFNQEDFLFELIPLSSENKFKLIVSSFKNTSFPLFRYELGDVIEIISNKCNCGIKGPRFRFVGRTKYITLPKGVKLYDWEIKNILSEFRGVKDYNLSLKKKGSKNILFLKLFITSEFSKEQLSKISKKVKKISHDVINLIKHKELYIKIKVLKVEKG